MTEKTSNSLIPTGPNPTKEQIRTNLKKMIEATHEHHKGKKEHYRINVIAGGPLGEFSKEELEEMGCTVRGMPKMGKEPVKKKDK